MALTPGTRLGVYEVIAQIGVGGMGEVYKARDTRLDRAVAVKILPALLAADPQFRERFDREARAISQLSHANICTLYDVGEHDGTAFLVLELLDGETLESRLSRGGPGGHAIPLAEALQIAIQVTDALAVAHRAGIVHRDLKPGNIFLVRTGASSPPITKLLDFGLAKTSAPAVAVGGATMMPTTPASVTAQGTILGTFQYMAPEQIEGMEADARTDLFAFGCVLYEMLTGKTAFEGKTRASLLGAILKDEPPAVSTVQPITPAALDRIVATCLAKDPEERWQTARDLQRELKWVAGGSASAVSDTPTARAAQRDRSRMMLLVATAIASAAIVGGAVWMLARPALPSPPAVHLQAPPNPDVALWVDTIVPDLAISPDGTHLAYTGGTGQSQLYVRSLSQDEAVPLAGIRNIRGPFFSPDGEWIGYFQGADLRKVSVRGGPPITICSNCAGGNRGATWVSDDAIIFCAAGGNSGLLRVPAGGGQPTALAKPDSQKGESYMWPHALPGGRAVLFTVVKTGSADEALIVVRDLTNGTQQTLVHGGTFPVFVRGYLVYGATGTLRAIRFDPATFATSGNQVPVLEGVASKGTGAVDLSVSSAAAMAYITGAQSALDVTSFDRRGHEERLNLPTRPYASVRISPDGQRIALDVSDQENDIWIWDVARRTFAPLTSGPTVERNPIWTPDGGRIVFSSARLGKQNLYWQATDGTGSAERLTTSANPQVPLTFTPDGKSLLFREADPVSGISALYLLSLDGDRTPKPLMRTPINAPHAALSPDGRWLAYQSVESTASDIHLRPFPDVERGHWQISNDGGTRPAWAASGHELFYLDARNRLMTVSFQAKPFAIGNPSAAFATTLPSIGLARSYDVMPDGKHILVIKNVAQNGSADQPNQLRVILNWDEELKRLAPPKR